MKILILEGDRFLFANSEQPEVGKTYILEDAGTHSAQQRKTWHALVQEWWKSGMNNIDTLDFHLFRETCKKQYGEGFSHYEYIGNDVNMVRVKDLSEIPQDILDDFKNVHRQRIKGVLKSFTKYTKKQVKDSIDKIIVAMDECGVDTVKYHEILGGMESE